MKELVDSTLVAETIDFTRSIILGNFNISQTMQCFSE